MKEKYMILYEENKSLLFLQVHAKQSVIVLTHISLVDLKRS